MSLRVIATGGTFEKIYQPLTGQLGFEHSQLPALIKLARLTIPVTFEPVMLLDSLDMTDEHRQQVLAACARAPEERIVIVHGTDTMPQTAQVLGQAGLNKRIVLTGAMVPYTVAGSDAAFNLGFAMACTLGEGQGVWIAMNGRLHPWQTVRKNRELGLFES